MNSIKDFYCGDIDSGPIKEIHPGKPCTSCSYFKLCGGRCLYSNYAKLWPKKGEELICNTVKHLINEIKRVTPTIKKIINTNNKSNKIEDHNTIGFEDFVFEKYFGPEIVP